MLIVLASKSPRRKALLKQLGLDFVAVESDVLEKFNPRLKARGQAEALASLKVQAVVEKLRERKSRGSIVIGADTVVVAGEEVLGKPRDDKEAKRMLRKLSGKSHVVITGFAIIDLKSGKMIVKSEETKVFFRKLSVIEIERYVLCEKLDDKSGAYAIQGRAAVFVERIEGDYFNIVGLPIFAVARELRRFGVDIMKVR